mgnify:CR=1 FL=1
MNKFEIKSKELEKVIIKIAIIQILSLVITCFIGMWMTSKELYFEQIYIVPCYAIIVFGIVRLNNKWCNRIDAM